VSSLQLQTHASGLASPTIQSRYANIAMFMLSTQSISKEMNNEHLHSGTKSSIGLATPLIILTQAYRARIF
jgi:hypothetical protein